MTRLTPETAALYARTALGHVTREWPYKMDHVFTGPQDVMAPRDAHPIFFGSFDADGMRVALADAGVTVAETAGIR